MSLISNVSLCNSCFDLDPKNSHSSLSPALPERWKSACKHMWLCVTWSPSFINVYIRTWEAGYDPLRHLFFTWSFRTYRWGQLMMENVVQMSNYWKFYSIFTSWYLYLDLCLTDLNFYKWAARLLRSVSHLTRLCGKQDAWMNSTLFTVNRQEETWTIETEVENNLKELQLSSDLQLSSTLLMLVWMNHQVFVLMVRTE